MPCLSVKVIIGNDEAQELGALPSPQTLSPCHSPEFFKHSPEPFSSVDPPALCHYLFRNLAALERLLITRWDKLKVALFGCHRHPRSRRQLPDGIFLTLPLLFNVFLTKGGFGVVEWVDTFCTSSPPLIIFQCYDGTFVHFCKTCMTQL